MDIKKKRSYQNLGFFCLFFLPYLAVTLFLFHRQSVHYGGAYTSDITPYIEEMQHIDSGYNFPYPLLFLTGRLFLPFTSPEHAMAIAVTLLNGLTAILLKFFMDGCVQAQDNIKRGFFSTLLVFSLLFSSMLYPLTYLGRYQEPGPDFLYRYLGVFTPNPYHNATYLAARAFSVPAFFLLADILSFYETENKWFHPKYLFFSVFLLLSTLAKPSFTLILAATAGLVMVSRLVRGRFRNGKAFFQLGIYFIPTFLTLLYQYGNVFYAGGGQETGMGIGFLKAWSIVSDHIPGSILLGMAFPLTVLLFWFIGKKTAQRTSPPSRDNRCMPGKLSCLFRLSWQFYLVALATLAFLYEKGYRLPHVNFAWGYMYGLFFAYTVSLIILAHNTLEHKKPYWQLGAQWFIYGLHLLCGLDYFRVLLQGGIFH